jgi:hypothetical protein
MIRAVAFVPPGPLNQVNEGYLNNCLTHIDRRGYKLAGLVSGDFPAALAMIRAGNATVIVFARREHLNDQWEPRLEVCGEETIRICEGKLPRPRNDGPRNDGGRNDGPRNDGPGGRRPRRIE